MLKFNSVVFFSILFVFLISSLKSIYIFNFKFASDVNTLRRNCVVLSKNSVSEDKITYLVKYDSNNFLLNIKKDEDILYDEFINQNEFNYGDVLSFRANIYIPQKLNNPYEFDYKMYLNSNNIVAIFSTDKVEKIGEKKDNIFLYIGSILKNFINKKVDENLQGNEASLYKSMLYGEDIYLSSDVKNYFSNNGLLHILATSGMHMFYIIMILNIILFF